MTVDVRTLTDADLGTWADAVQTGFHHVPADPDGAFLRGRIDLDRTWGAFDGGRAVATLRSFSAAMTMPGGSAVSASAVTAVTTTATHRRTGLASAMMAGEMAAGRDRGEVVAALIAAEHPIYGRFGFGPAAWQSSWTVDARDAELSDWVPTGTVELIGVGPARIAAPELADRVRRGRPGDLDFDDRFWDRTFGIVHPPGQPEPKPAFHLLARDPHGAVIGLARFRVVEKWENWRPCSEVEVEVLMTADAAAVALIWRHLVSMDHISVIRSEGRPVDDPVRWLLADARRAVPSGAVDFFWARPLDTAAFLAGRRYRVAGTLVLQVIDPLGLSGGRFLLDGGPDGARCTTTDRSPDLTLGVGALASIGLGGVSAATLAAVGRIDEHHSGAVDRTTLQFGAAVAPWCSATF